MPTDNRSFKVILIRVATFVVSFVLISLISMFLWIAFTPRFPSFQVTSVTVISLSTNTAAELTATFDVDVILRNPNIVLSVWYESLDLALWFDRRNISSAPIQPLSFSTGADTDTPLRARFTILRRTFPSGVTSGIASQRRFLGSVDFGVKFLARLRFKFGIARTTVRALTVDCYPLRVVFPPNNDTGRLVAPSDCYRV
ncbi:NDR1/HIN1-like protein 6, partial [Mucuna pruriens]